MGIEFEGLTTKDEGHSYRNTVVYNTVAGQSLKVGDPYKVKSTGSVDVVTALASSDPTGTTKGIIKALWRNGEVCQSIATTTVADKAEVTIDPDIELIGTYKVASSPALLNVGAKLSLDATTRKLKGDSTNGQFEFVKYRYPETIVSTDNTTYNGVMVEVRIAPGS